MGQALQLTLFLELLEGVLGLLFGLEGNKGVTRRPLELQGKGDLDADD